LVSGFAAGFAVGLAAGFLAACGIFAALALTAGWFG
jgi:hypothetical protein